VVFTQDAPHVGGRDLHDVDRGHGQLEAKAHAAKKPEEYFFILRGRRNSWMCNKVLFYTILLLGHGIVHLIWYVHLDHAAGAHIKYTLLPLPWLGGEG
jgi:hypothetical protein